MEKWKAEREARLARGEKEEEEEEEEEINIYAVTEEEVRAWVLSGAHCRAQRPHLQDGCGNPSEEHREFQTGRAKGPSVSFLLTGQFSRMMEDSI